MARTTKANHMTVRNLLFLLAPEDSSEVLSVRHPARFSGGWHRIKSVLWYAISIILALLIGQLQ